MSAPPAVRPAAAPLTGWPDPETLQQAVLDGAFGPDPRDVRISTAFATSQAVRHDGRSGGYRNEVLSLRLGAAVGSCAAEPGALPPEAVTDAVGADVATLLTHPLPVVRTAALDAYLMHRLPHTPAHGARPLALPAGTSLEKSRARARAVVELLAPVVPAGGRVLVVGVVNSLLEALRSAGLAYVPCDLKGGVTEWGEAVVREAAGAVGGCDAVLASGMTLGNGTFGPLRARAAAHGLPLVLFAQTGSAVLPRFVGAGVHAVCAEPYPFFWLDGGPGTLYRYGGSPADARCEGSGR
ncbi:hypothetical protein [Streptomyces catenulae]|uniref:Heavy-metal chelation domain-containing protein n=1 Tax=Streptomyces catenulae TaxID=66875 RepID=A0ABV2Z416_9ACTN|nr:hypothetical protein [Streptomyces catenulae]